MTKIAKVERYGRDGDIKTAPMKDPRDGIFIICKLSHPKSSKGQNVLLLLEEQDRDDLLRQLRQEAIRARQ